MNDRQDFRDRLIFAQQLTPDYREKYERSLESMFEKQLTLAQKINLWVAVVVGVAISAGTLYGVFAVKELPGPMVFVLGLLVIVLLTVTALRARAAITGTVNLRWHPGVIAQIGFFGVLIAVAVIAGYNALHPSIHSVYIMVVWIVPVIVVTAKLIGTTIEQSELKTKEKLLEIELRLAEMSEQMAKKQAE